MSECVFKRFSFDGYCYFSVFISREELVNVVYREGFAQMSLPPQLPQLPSASGCVRQIKFKHEDKGGNAIQLIKHFPRVQHCAPTSSLRSHPKSQTSVQNSEPHTECLEREEKFHLNGQFVTFDPTRSLISVHLL